MDYARGIAIVMMIIYHILWDINYFFVTDIELETGYWEYHRIITVSLFLFLVGISIAISNASKNAPLLKYLKRGTIILSYGIIITIITYLIIPDSYVRFGILHLIGVAIIISYLFTRPRIIALIGGIILLLLGLIANTSDASNSILLEIMGLTGLSSPTVDYYPIIPWMGIVLLGLYAGRILYPNNKRIYSIRSYNNSLAERTLCYMGRNSLKIYLIHQPILLTLFYILRLIL
ncbi:MAG: heparan-alpha-glucosaminide N-acetyltransferase [Candidatus Woesearchaeota archaeon]